MTTSNVLAALGRGAEGYRSRTVRVREMVRLHRLSDAELAALGLTRDGIAGHVFRDLLEG